MAEILMFSAARSYSVGEAIFLHSTGFTVAVNNSTFWSQFDFPTEAILASSSVVWTVPAGVNEICAVAIGGGGMGECSNTVDGGSGAGGGGGELVINYAGPRG